MEAFDAAAAAAAAFDVAGLTPAAVFFNEKIVAMGRRGARVLKTFAPEPGNAERLGVSGSPEEEVENGFRTLEVADVELNATGMAADFQSAREDQKAGSTPGYSGRSGPESAAT